MNDSKIYFIDFKFECGSWKNNSNHIYESKECQCFAHQSRTCTNEVAGRIMIETRENNVVCPKTYSCTWFNGKKQTPAQI